MSILNRINCALGNHKYSGRTTKVICIDHDYCRVEVRCIYCGEHSCFLTDYKRIDAHVNEPMTEGEGDWIYGI